MRAGKPVSELHRYPNYRNVLYDELLSWLHTRITIPTAFRMRERILYASN